ncbi:MAG: arylsulfotransferase family protein, partial [Acidimicrobiia bacterium]
WDLGVGGFGAGLANPSIAWGVIYVPTDRELVAVHPTNIEPLAALTTSPLALSPAFSPSIAAYVLRCATGTNSVSFTMTAAPGGAVKLVAPFTTSPSASQTVNVPLLENQAAVMQANDAQGRIRQYWVRCLPADFPPINVTRHPSAGTPTPGWYLMGNNIKAGAHGYFAMVLDTNGTPVWYRRTATPPLDVTLMGPNKLGYFGANNRFDIETLPSGATSTVETVGVATDPHELLTLPNGNTMLMSYPPKSGVDLTGLNATPTPGPNSTIVDCVLQEIDAQGQLVWEWTASDHIDPVTEPTLAPLITGDGPSAYDVYHCNSIDARPNGDLLVSARHLNAVFEIRRSDGLVTWKMGGKPTNKDGAEIIGINNDPSGTIVLMHDARYLPNGNVSIFDNQTASTGAAARGVEYSIDFGTNTAEPVFWYPFPSGAASCCMGSFRRYPDGHSVVGWGWVMSNPRVMTELNAAGDEVLEIAFSSGNASYRAVKVPPPRLDLNFMRQSAGRG